MTISKALPETRYVPQRLNRMGWRVYGLMAAELVGARELLWRLVWRDLLLRTKISFLGIFWSVAQPLALMFVFVFLRQAKVVNFGNTEMEYALFAFVGIIHWNLLTSMFTQSAGSLLGASNLVAKVKFPREVLVLAACGRALADWAFALPILLILFLWFGVTPAWTIVFAPLVLIPIVLLGAGIGMLLAMLTLPVRDVGQALPLVMAPLMFLTPVFYEFPSGGPWLAVNILNPMAVCIGVIRDLIFSGTIREPYLLTAWALASILIFVAAWRTFCLMMPKVPEYA